MWSKFQILLKICPTADCIKLFICVSSRFNNSPKVLRIDREYNTQPSLTLLSKNYFTSQSNPESHSDQLFLKNQLIDSFLFSNFSTGIQPEGPPPSFLNLFETQLSPLWSRDFFDMWDHLVKVCNQTWSLGDICDRPDQLTFEIGSRRWYRILF